MAEMRDCDPSDPIDANMRYLASSVDVLSSEERQKVIDDRFELLDRLLETSESSNTKEEVLEAADATAAACEALVQPSARAPT